MIGSTLQLSLNRAKVSFLPCGTNEKFINLCRIGGPVEGEGWLKGGTLTTVPRETLCFTSSHDDKGCDLRAKVCGKSYTFIAQLQ